MVEIKSRYENDGGWEYFQLCYWWHCIYCCDLVAEALDSNCMRALPPKVHVSFGTSDQAFLERIQNKFKKNSVPFESKHNEVLFIQQGYKFSILHTPEFHSDTPRKLNLPLSI